MKIEKSINIKHNLSMPKKILKFILITIISLCILPTEGAVAQTAQPSSSCDVAYSECVLACNSDNACIKKCEEQKQICVDSLTVGAVQSMECRGIANPLCLATSAIGLASNGLYSGLESFLNISPTIFQSGDIADLIKEKALLGGTPEDEEEIARIDAQIESLRSKNTMDVAWRTMRDIANISFTIILMIVVISYITGLGLNMYSIKKILPKLIVSIILVNLSYYVCQIAVDLSNIVGASVRSLFQAVESNVSGTGNPFDFGAIISTAVAVVLGTTAIAGAADNMAYKPIIIGFLISIVLTLLVTMMAMMVRQALIIILIVLSPIAFVSMILPNTQSFYNLWKKLFISMLMVFPIIGVLFGASKLAASLINLSSSTGGLGAPILGIMSAAINVLPLIAAPGLIKSAVASAPMIGQTFNKLAGQIQGGGNKSWKNSDTNKAMLNQNRQQQEFKRLRGPRKFGSGDNGTWNLGAALNDKARYGMRNAPGSIIKNQEIQESQFKDIKSKSNNLMSTDPNILNNFFEKIKGKSEQEIAEMFTANDIDQTLRQTYHLQGNDVAKTLSTMALTQANGVGLSTDNFNTVAPMLQKSLGNTIASRFANEVRSASKDRGNPVMAAHVAGVMGRAKGDISQASFDNNNLVSDTQNYFSKMPASEWAATKPFVFDKDSTGHQALTNLVSPSSPMRNSIIETINAAKLSPEINPATITKLNDIVSSSNTPPSTS